jgi:mannose-1-phosphate guanylyltransferase
MDVYAVIMAGGVGSRFWPRSRKKTPKQLLNIFGENSMIRETFERLEGFIQPENILIITNKVQKALIEEQLPEIPEKNIIAEPVGRNTAACVALSAAIINNITDNSVIVTLPADHLIKDKKKFIDTLNNAINFANKSNGLITFGINPTRPDTGYGYINYDKNEIEDGIHKVKRFVEKPDEQTAQTYFESGEYFWNSGMFVWKTDTIAEELKKELPATWNALLEPSKLFGNSKFKNSLNKSYENLENISIDYAVMEKSRNVFTIKGDFDWSDVGSWETVYTLAEKDENGNSLTGDVFTKSVKNSYVYSPTKFTAVIDVENCVIINTDDSLLVCSRDKVQQVKEVVDHLNEKDRTDLI